MLTAWGRRRGWDPDFADEVAQCTLEAWIRSGRRATIPPEPILWLRARGHARKILDARLPCLGDGVSELPAAPQDRQGATPFAIQDALQTLPERERIVLIRCYLCSESRKEVAESLGLSAGALRLLLYRARKALKQRLQRDEDGIGVTK